MPRVFRLPIPTAVAVALAAAASAAQPDPRPADGALATLLTPNGEMRLTLTSRALYVGFTALGHRRIRRAADSAFAAAYGAKGAAGAAAGDDAPGPDKPEKADKPIPLRDVQQVRAAGDSLVLCFASKAGPGPAAPPCTMWRRIVVTGLPSGDAQRFAEAVRRARARSLGAGD